MYNLIVKETEQEVLEHFNSLGIDGVGFETTTPNVIWHKIPHDYSQDYLTFEMLESGEILWVKETDTSSEPREIPTLTIEYSKDNGEHWASIASTESGTPISVSAEDKVMFRGLNDRYGIDEDWWWCAAYFSGAPSFNMFGNIMSLCYGDNFATATTLKADWTFTAIFHETNVVDAGNLVLPATTLLYGCYDEMFEDCSSLTTAPELPATTLAYDCYDSMFSGCTSLTTAPELPATTLAHDCYYGMFQNCTSLTTAPVLPATTLVDYCYAEMFRGCTSLNYIKCLATDISANNCIYDWVYDVAAPGTFVKAPSMDDWELDSSSGIPEGWTVVDAS